MTFWGADGFVAASCVASAVPVVLSVSTVTTLMSYDVPFTNPVNVYEESDSEVSVAVGELGQLPPAVRMKSSYRSKVPPPMTARVQLAVTC